MSQDVGVSKKALSVARSIDRLAPGEYIVHLSKRVRHDEGGEFEQLDFKISRQERITSKQIGNYGKQN